MSRKQYRPSGGSHEKKVTRKERKKMRAENPVNAEGNLEVIAPDENDKKQLRNLTIFSIIGLIALMILMYFIFVSS